MLQFTGKHTFIIAEIGKNFIQTQEEKTVSEYLENAKELVRLAKEAGADAVKFQTHWVEDEQLDIHVVSPHFKGADRYSWVTRNAKMTPLEEFWRPLKEYCDEIGIIFFSTPMSRGAAIMLNKLNPQLWKVSSPDLLDFVLLDYLASTGKHVILSSGMTTLEELDHAIAFAKKRKLNFSLLHCVSKYPCPPEELSLATMEFLRERYQVPIGFSDHSLSDEAPAAAVALGAKIIEKHFSTSRQHWGADHKVSMHPDEFKRMVARIRAVEKDPSKAPAHMKDFMGKKGKILQDDEAPLRGYFRKSLMAGADLPAGTVLKAEHIYAMRPQSHAGGMPSKDLELVLGKKLKRALKKFDPITNDVLH